MCKTAAIALRPYRGFTLIELMVGIAVLAILVAVGIPSFASIINNNRISSATNNLVVALNYARSEAIKRGDPVTVCAANSTLTDCSKATAWAPGWIAIRDIATPYGELNTGDEILQVWAGVDPSLTLTGSTPASASPSGKYVQYIPNGMTQPTIATTFDLWKSGCSGMKARRITVTNSGRIGSAAVNCPP